MSSEYYSRYETPADRLLKKGSLFDVAIGPIIGGFWEVIGSLGSDKEDVHRFVCAGIRVETGQLRVNDFRKKNDFCIESLSSTGDIASLAGFLCIAFVSEEDAVI